VNDLVDDVERLAVLSDELQRRLQCQRSVDVEVATGTEGATGGQTPSEVDRERARVVEENADGQLMTLDDRRQALSLPVADQPLYASPTHTRSASK